MNGKKRNLITDTEAVSGVIGAILLMAIFVTMFTMLQATAVPMWNKQVEAVEIRVTYDDMMFLPSDIEDVAMHGTPKTCTVQLGAQYPDRMIFRNPGLGAYGTLAVEEEPVSVTVTYYYNGSTQIKTFDSKRITYEMSGTINSPKIVYEHGVIIADWRATSGENAIVTTDEQTLIDRNENLYIPIVNGRSRSKSTIGSETMVIYPYLYNDSINASWVNVTLDTEYPKLWYDTLFNDSTVLPDLNLQNTDVCVDIDDKKIYINNTVPQYLKYPDQIASGPLYAGLISYTVEDPDGGSTGNGEGFQGPWYTGNGTGSVTDGSLWQNMPSSDTITQFVLTNIIVDNSTMEIDLNCDCIIIQVTDIEGNWWRAEITFDWNYYQPKDVHPKITTVVVKAKDKTEDTKTLDSIFDTSTTIDFLSITDFPNSCYQNAGIGPINTLHVEIAEDPAGQSQEAIALKWFNLIIEGS